MASPEILHWICNVPIGLLICGFGVFGNVLSVYVWRRVIRKNIQGNQSTAMYLITLGICDIFLLVFFILCESIPTAIPQVKSTFIYGALISWFSFPMLYIFVVASIWLIVGVTINRWVLITFPTRARQIYSKSRTYLSIFLILFCSVLINIPHWFNLRVRPAKNGTFVIEKTEYGVSQGAINYEFWCHCIVLVLAPWFIIASINFLIVRKLRERTKKITCVTNKPDRHTQDGNLTMMLLAITFSFLLLIAWQCITQCFYMLEYGKDENIIAWYRVDKAYAFGKLGVVINSTINSIFYCWFGSSFRKELKESLSSSFSFGGILSAESSWNTKSLKEEIQKSKDMGEITKTSSVDKHTTNTNVTRITVQCTSASMAAISA